MRRTVKIFDELFSVTYSYMLGPLLYKIRVCSAVGPHGIVPIDPIAEQMVRYRSGSPYSVATLAEQERTMATHFSGWSVVEDSYCLFLQLPM